MLLRGVGREDQKLVTGCFLVKMENMIAKGRSNIVVVLGGRGVVNRWMGRPGERFLLVMWNVWM